MFFKLILLPVLLPVWPCEEEAEAFLEEAEESRIKLLWIETGSGRI
jgi:hypothetical protein